MQIGLIGINHKLADLHLRNTFAKVCERQFHHNYFSHEEHFLVTLSTCNRTEIYFTSSNLAETHSFILNILKQEIEEENFDQKLYSYFGYECFNHLSRVTSGLDSACVAETEIQGQVKNAYENVTSTLNLPYDLHFLFQKSLAIGKQVRSSLNLGRGLPGLQEAVFEQAALFFGSLDAVKVLFVGGSSINEKIASHKKFKGGDLMTRSKERADELQARLKLKPVLWNPKGWIHYDWVIFGSKTPDYLIRAHELPSLSEKKLIMDLSVPSNVDPKLRDIPFITLLNIDEINLHLANRQKQLKSVLAEADELVDTLTERHQTLWHQKHSAKLKLHTHSFYPLEKLQQTF